MVKESNLNPQTQALINTFCEITSSSKSQALFFLESHNFDLDSAVSTFLENTSLPSASVAATAAADPVSPSDSQSYSPSHSDSSSPSGSRSPSPLPSISSKRKRKPSNAYNLRSSRPRNAAAGKVAVADAAVAVGRRSLNRQSTTGSGSDSDEPQEYSIRKSECPKEHEPADRKTSVRVNLTMSEEDCPVPEKHHASSQGVGRTLGNTSNAVAVESTVAVSSFTAAPAPSVGLVVDQTQPSTSIQIRLADGTRMVSRFNFQHSIRDIRGFIDASRPGGPRSYQLQTVGFPPKELADLNQTIEQADLANSVVIQKL